MRRIRITLALFTSMAVVFSSCKKEEGVTYAVSYVSSIEAQDNLRDYEHYHMTSTYYHGIPEGTDSASVMQMFIDDYGTDNTIYATYAYCLDKNWGRQTSPAFGEDGYDKCQYRIECRSDKVNPYEIQYQLGILDSNYQIIHK